MSIGFQGAFLQEIINNLDGEDVTFKLAGPTRAGLIVPAEQPEKEEVVMLLMPMLVND
jgi:DNA polymerase-3 subunit beta